MADKTFGIDPDQRISVPTGLRRTGVEGGKGIYDKYFNQLLFEVNQDHIIGTASQLTTGDATLKYQSSDQTLRDKDDNIVVLSDGDRVYIIGLDTLTADFDLSAYDRLRVVSDPSVSLANGSFNLDFGDDCVLDLHITTKGNITFGTGCRVYINNVLNYGVLQSNIIAYTSDGVAPIGWTEYTAARGRIIVGLPSGGTNEGTIGTAFTDQQDKSDSHSHTVDSHSHGDGTLAAKINFTSGLITNVSSAQSSTHDREKSVSGGIAGGSTTRDDTDVSGSTGSESPGTNNATLNTSDFLAYIQLMAIKKD